jgi:hypothetical protein
MRNLLAKIARILTQDALWLALFVLITRWQPRVTVRTAITVPTLWVVLCLIFQLACCVRLYLISYRDTLARLSQKG